MASSSKKPSKDPEGRMSLGDHLRELRNRLVIAAVGVVLGAVVGWFLYDWLFDTLQYPFREFQRHGGNANLNFQALTTALDMKIKVSMFVGVIITAPLWIYQLWAFITPGLHRHERRYALGFLGSAVPLFLAGCYLAWLLLPRAVPILLEFTPHGSTNFVDVQLYITFVIRFLLAFGLAFLFPVILVALNFVGVLSARNMIRAWRWVIFLIFLFTAIATPTPDAWTMIIMALPMIGLYFGAYGISVMHDRRKRIQQAKALEVPDEEPSKI